MTGANIGLADFASGSLRAGILTLDQLAQGLRPFEQSGVWQSSGEPIPYDGDLAPRLIVDVTSINRELLDMVRSNPNLLYSLPTRKFEEIVAELLLRLGYKVELTPPTRDGGFDMYAAKHEILGKFLYLVECKRYAPSHRVGVEIVRSLYGVVQQKKATAGIVATTSFFTSIAKNLQRELEHQMQLADYFDLQRWLGLL